MRPTKGYLSSRTVRRAIYGAVVSVLGYVSAWASGAVEEFDARVLVGIVVGSVLTGLGAVMGRRDGFPNLRLQAKKRKGKIAAIILAVGLASSSCSGFSSATVDKILRTASAGVSILADWCDPDTFPAMDAGACESISRWAEMGVSGLALFLPTFVDPEYGDDDTPDSPARVVVVPCVQVEPVCEFSARSKIHREICAVLTSGCAENGVLVALDPEA